MHVLAAPARAPARAPAAPASRHRAPAGRRHRSGAQEEPVPLGLPPSPGRGVLPRGLPIYSQPFLTSTLPPPLQDTSRTWSRACAETRVTGRTRRQSWAGLSRQVWLSGLVSNEVCVSPQSRACWHLQHRHIAVSRCILTKNASTASAQTQRLHPMFLARSVHVPDGSRPLLSLHWKCGLVCEKSPAASC